MFSLPLRFTQASEIVYFVTKRILKCKYFVIGIRRMIHEGLTNLMINFVGPRLITSNQKGIKLSPNFEKIIKYRELLKANHYG